MDKNNREKTQRIEWAHERKKVVVVVVVGCYLLLTFICMMMKTNEMTWLALLRLCFIFFLSHAEKNRRESYFVLFDAIRFSCIICKYAFRSLSFPLNLSDALCDEKNFVAFFLVQIIIIININTHTHYSLGQIWTHPILQPQALLEHEVGHFCFSVLQSKFLIGFLHPYKFVRCCFIFQPQQRTNNNNKKWNNKIIEREKILRATLICWRQ